MAPVRAALYARVSTTLGQSTENQLLELRRYAEARGWTATEYVDDGISGSKANRPALDRLLRGAKRRRVDVVVCWSLDRLGRSLKHLVILLDDLQALDLSLVSIREGLDWTTPTGKLQAQLLAMIAEFERSRTIERVRAGMARAKAEGKHVGRPRKAVTDAELEALSHLSVRDAARMLGVSKSFVAQWRASKKAA